MLGVTLFGIVFSILIVAVRLIRGKTIWTKLLALNLIAIQAAMLIVTYAVYINSSIVMDVAIAYSVIGFLVLVLLTRFIASGGN